MNNKEKYAESMNALNAALEAWDITIEVLTELDDKIADADIIYADLMMKAEEEARKEAYKDCDAYTPAEDACVDAEIAYNKANKAHQKFISELPANFFE